jgi:hypothetical protein
VSAARGDGLFQGAGAVFGALRELTLLGHKVRQMPAKDVRAYVKPMRRRDLRGGSPANDADLCM